MSLPEPHEIDVDVGYKIWATSGLIFHALLLLAASIQIFLEKRLSVSGHNIKVSQTFEVHQKAACAGARVQRPKPRPVHHGAAVKRQRCCQMLWKPLPRVSPLIFWAHRSVLAATFFSVLFFIDPFSFYGILPPLFTESCTDVISGVLLSSWCLFGVMSNRSLHCAMQQKPSKAFDKVIQTLMAGAFLLIIPENVAESVLDREWPSAILIFMLAICGLVGLFPVLMMNLVVFRRWTKTQAKLQDEGVRKSPGATPEMIKLIRITRLFMFCAVVLFVSQFIIGSLRLADTSVVHSDWSWLESFSVARIWFSLFHLIGVVLLCWYAWIPLKALRAPRKSPKPAKEVDLECIDEGLPADGSTV